MSRPLLQTVPVALALFLVLVAPASAARKQPPATHNVSLESANNAEWRGSSLSTPLLVKLQVLLDRAHASPGEIDANRGENTRKAVAGFREMRGLGGVNRLMSGCGVRWPTTIARRLS
jgi:peptidoglycan hydrolase-like protein with peptidoglycan-binding domain